MRFSQISAVMPKTKSYERIPMSCTVPAGGDNIPGTATESLNYSPVVRVSVNSRVRLWVTILSQSRIPIPSRPLSDQERRKRR